MPLDRVALRDKLIADDEHKGRASMNLTSELAEAERRLSAMINARANSGGRRGEGRQSRARQG